MLGFLRRWAARRALGARIAFSRAQAWWHERQGRPLAGIAALTRTATLMQRRAAQDVQ